MPKTLVIRLSALGDVAMLIPVLYSCAKKYSHEEFLLITKTPLLPIFEHRPVNVDVLAVDNKQQHKGIFGLKNLIGELSLQNITKVVDTHDVLRSKVIRTFFLLKGIKVAHINKERQRQWTLTRKNNKIFHPLHTSFEKYYKVFRQLGYDFTIDFKSIFEFGTRDFCLIEPLVGQKSGIWIGIAPFAKHLGKIYPFERMQEVVEKLASDSDKKIFLFGGEEETTQLSQLSALSPNIISVAGKLSFSTELLLMSYLDIMLTMDSGNMHLASLVATPVVSIWGATHPYAGFYGYGQKEENAIQANLSCRPCSIYGNKPCYKNSYECLTLITPAMIVERVNSSLSHRFESEHCR